jgi:hypothetical protein
MRTIRVTLMIALVLLAAACAPAAQAPLPTLHPLAGQMGTAPSTAPALPTPTEEAPGPAPADAATSTVGQAAPSTDTGPAGLATAPADGDDGPAAGGVDADAPPPVVVGEALGPASPVIERSVDGGYSLSVRYPEGWVSVFNGTTLQLATSGAAMAEETLDAGEVAVTFVTYPQAYIAGLIPPEGQTQIMANDILADFLRIVKQTQMSLDFEQIEQIQTGREVMVRAIARDPSGDVVAMVRDFGGMFVLMSAVTAPGAIDAHLPLLTEMLISMNYGE